MVKIFMMLLLLEIVMVDVHVLLNYVQIEDGRMEFNLKFQFVEELELVGQYLLR